VLSPHQIVGLLYTSLSTLISKQLEYAPSLLRISILTPLPLITITLLLLLFIQLLWPWAPRHHGWQNRFLGAKWLRFKS